jgi:VCBS repeat-containing protein
VSGASSMALDPIDLVDQPPSAADDFHAVAEDTTLSVVAPGVLANDLDPDGDPLVAVVATQPKHGTVDLASDGSFTYHPAADYNGLDSFTYKAVDGALESAPVTVTITVTPVNDPPVAAADEAQTLEDTGVAVQAPGVLSNDRDVDGTPLSAELVTDAEHGVARRCRDRCPAGRLATLVSRPFRA